MAEYKLAVTTGSMAHAGTMDHIYATLIGTKGRSERKELNNWGPNFVTGTTQTYTIKPKVSLGKLLLLKLEKERFLVLPENQWFCSKITVTAPEGEILFPCYRWIANGDLVELRGGIAKKKLDDDNETLTKHREKELMMRKGLYMWAISDPKIPHHLPFTQESHLPDEVQYSWSRYLELGATEGWTRFKLRIKGMLGSTEQWGKIEEMNDILWIQKTTMSEYVAKHWKEDDFFGYQFLNGTNPCVIKKCSKLPKNFPVTDEMVKTSLETGSSLNEEIEKGNIFICDNKIMEKIPTRMYGKEHLQMPASMCLFYMNPEKKLMPIAIQLSQKPEENPIFLPSDDETDWLLAKIFVKSAHTLEFESVHHLMRTHLLAEVFGIATVRNFPQIHPLYKLLIPHFDNTAYINTLARSLLIGPKGLLNTSTLGYEGTMELVRQGLSETTYRSLCLPDDIEYRGVESIPNYYYREDGLKLWDIINSYVGKMVEYYYPSDTDVSQDTELQDWIQEVFTHGFLGNKHSEIPSDFTDVGNLVKFLTMVIFTVTAQHAAVNNGQFDYLSWVLNGSLLLRKPPPTTKGQSSEETILETIPNKEETGSFVFLSLILSKTFSHTSMLGAHPHDRFDEPKPKKIMQEFKAELAQLSKEIDTRNADLDIPYEYLNPKQIENSVSI